MHKSHAQPAHHQPRRQATAQDRRLGDAAVRGEDQRRRCARDERRPLQEEARREAALPREKWPEGFKELDLPEKVLFYSEDEAAALRDEAIEAWRRALSR